MKDALLKAALFTPMPDGGWGLPLLIKGSPGTGKTATIEALGAQWGLPVESLSPGERGEGAFGVTPVPVTNGEITLSYPAPDWVKKLRGPDGHGEEAGIVFVDELNTAAPAIQPALLGLIQARRIGGHRLGPRVRVLGACNPISQSAGGWDLAPPVANRLGHVDWPAPDAEEWGAWITGGTDAAKPAGSVEAEEARVMAAWPQAYAKACALVASFLRRRPELLSKMPPDGDPAQAAAWPSPRTWEYAARAMAAGWIHGLSGVEQDELIQAFVGASAGGELGAWIDEQDLPDPAEVLDCKVAWGPDPRRIDRTEAVLSACAALVKTAADPGSKRLKVLWGLISSAADGAKDVVIPAMRMLVKAGLHLDGKKRISPEARGPLAKCLDVYKAAGGDT